MAKINEIELQSFPLKVVVKPNSIELWLKRMNADWKCVISIKVARKNIDSPWSIRYFEYGTAKYGKYRTWKDVKEKVAEHYLVELPDHINEKLTAKIMMNKISK